MEDLGLMQKFMHCMYLLHPTQQMHDTSTVALH
jgi:hypothetical protein